MVTLAVCRPPLSLFLPSHLTLPPVNPECVGALVQVVGMLVAVCGAERGGSVDYAQFLGAVSGVGVGEGEG